MKPFLITSFVKLFRLLLMMMTIKSIEQLRTVILIYKYDYDLTKSTFILIHFSTIHFNPYQLNISFPR